MKHVLLVDTNFSSAPIHQFLVQSGYKVTVIGSNPSDALAKSAPNYIEADYSEISTISQLIADLKIDFLVPGCNDRSYMVCAQLNREGIYPGLDSLETAEIINNKQKFREFATQLSLPVPRVLTDQEIGKRWPIIVKPVDSFSGKGVTVISEKDRHNLTNAENFARKESPSNNCIVEEYVFGQLYSHTAFLQKGQIISDYIVEEHGTVNPFVVDTSKVDFSFNFNVLAQIRQDISLIAQELCLNDGLIHTQFIKSNSKYWLIEVTRRCPGDLYSQLIELTTGMKYAENYARPFLGLPFSFMTSNYQKKIIRHTLTQSNNFTLGSLEFHIPIFIKKWVPIALTGDQLGASPKGRIGILFIELSSEQDLKDVFEKTLERQLYTVSSH